MFLPRPLLRATLRPSLLPRPRLFASVNAYSTGAEAAKPAPPEHLNEKETAIFNKLSAALEPTRLEVQDVSGGCGSMYAIEITAAAFKGVNMVKQHRIVNEVLAEEIKGWHGMQLRTKAA
ncbi:bola protein [Geopyxis carbonaria]|nr:bola protein [Geopyxis carbonaria]